ncbi:hypothetical protein [Oceanobacillus salinisoli]|uniref:hypothetical protein n=1 Tax=Oceanobacillus salinisoli TaxID=2678611 RepID=UPI0012E15DD1|nr:hypothetical protein [Oceanobacillus salinisoli]
MFQDAFWLAKKELKHHWSAIALSLLFTVFVGGSTGMLLADSAVKMFEDHATSYNCFLLDLIFLGLTPAFATIFMAKPYLTLQTIKEDPYSKRMAFLRSLPIPVNVLAFSRTIVMFIILLIMSSAFYLSIVFVLIGMSSTFYDFISTGEFLIFIFIWFGYALAVGGINPFIEYGTNGKVLHLFPFIFFGLFLIFILNFYNYTGQGVVEMILYYTKNAGWPLAILSLVMGGFGCYIWNKLLTIRLKKRDYV